MSHLLSRDYVRSRHATGNDSIFRPQCGVLVRYACRYGAKLSYKHPSLIHLHGLTLLMKHSAAQLLIVQFQDDGNAALLGFAAGVVRVSCGLYRNESFYRLKLNGLLSPNGDGESRTDDISQAHRNLLPSKP